MTLNANAQAINETSQELPEETGQAMRMLISISERLVDLSNRETQSLVQNDMITFSVLQNEKFQISEQYEALCANFRNRLEDFRGTDKAMLDRLEALQKELGVKLRSNRDIVQRVNDNALSKMKKSIGLSDNYFSRFDQTTLLSAQETKDEA